MATMIEGFSTICRQEPDQRRYSHASHVSSNANNDSTSIMINALDNCTAKISVQLLAQVALRSIIHAFDGNDKAATIPWLDQVQLVTEGTDISKLNGLSLGNMTTIRKEEGLTWHKFRQILIENYSNIPYVSDTMVAYTQLTQQDDESTSQYLIRAKIFLEHMNHTSKLSQISGKGLNNLALV